jgi:hypothetical protein
MIIPHPDRDSTNSPDNWSEDREVAKYDAHTVQEALLAKGAIDSIHLFAPAQYPSAAEHSTSIYDQLAEQIASSGLSTVDQIALLETALVIKDQQERANADANANLVFTALVEAKPVSGHVANVNWNTVSLVPPKTRIPEFFRKK